MIYNWKHLQTNLCSIPIFYTQKCCKSALLWKVIASKITFAFGHLGPLKFVQEFPGPYICKLKHPPPRGIQIFYFVRNPPRINQKNLVLSSLCVYEKMRVQPLFPRLKHFLSSLVLRLQSKDRNTFQFCNACSFLLNNKIQHLKSPFGCLRGMMAGNVGDVLSQLAKWLFVLMFRLGSHFLRSLKLPFLCCLKTVHAKKASYRTDVPNLRR